MTPNPRPPEPAGGGSTDRRALRSGRGVAGFSVVEIVGVMCVLMILALMVSPSMLRQLEEQARRKEAETLSQITRALREYVLSTRQVPAVATVPTNVAQVLGWPVGLVVTNAFRNPRVFLYDPTLRLGATTASTLPYTQGAYGVSNLAGARMLVMSSLSGALPAIIASPGTNATTVFNAVWNTADGTMPAGWTWGGRWEDIKVQRLNLAPLFTQVVLNNNTATLGRFSIDNTAGHVLLPSNPFAAHYLARSVLGLHGNNGALQVMQVVPDANAATNNPSYFWFPSYVYEQGLWRGRLFMGLPQPRRAGQDLQAAYEIFMSGPPNVYKVGGVNQSSVTSSMWVFMSNYVVWADSGFSSSKRAAVTSAQSAMASQLGTYCNKKAKVP